MTTEWKACPTIEDVVEAKKRGDEIEYSTIYGGWAKWDQATWNGGITYRCHPAQPKTKTITLRKALMGGAAHTYTLESTDDVSGYASFVCWIGEPYTVEVPE